MVSSEQSQGRSAGEAPSAGVLRFGPYELDLEARELRKGGASLKLRQQPFTVLALLASRAGQVFTRDQIQRAVWGEDTHIDFAQGINYCIKEIRAALGDDAEHPTYVQTLARRGYRFIAPVAEVPAARPHARPDPPLPRPSRRRLVLGMAALAAALSAAVTLWLAAARREAHPDPAGPVTIAVLPFANLSGDPAQDYLSEGLTEEMIARLGRLQPERLRVVARPAPREYERRQRAVATLGQEPGAAYVLEGSVRHTGGRVRVTSRLTRTANQSQVWVDSFEAPLRDIIKMQGQMAREMAARIQLVLSPGEQARLRSAGRVDPEAYRRYLRGRYFWNKWNIPSLRRSIELYEEAVRRQPDYALAHAGAADAYIALADQSAVSPGEILAKARRAAERALQIDANLAEGHASLGMVLGIHELDWAGAERALRRAIELNPGYPTARLWYSRILSASGRLDEALEQVRIAEEAAPLSLIVIHDRGMVRLHRGELDLAVARFRAALDLDPQFGPALRGLARALLEQGRSADAIAALERAARLGQANARCRAALAHGYAATGQAREARLILAALEGEPNGRAYDIAVVQAALGDTQVALASLSRALEARDPALRGLMVDERLRGLRAQPGWRALLASTRLIASGEGEAAAVAAGAIPPPPPGPASAPTAAASGS